MANTGPRRTIEDQRGPHRTIQDQRGRDHKGLEGTILGHTRPYTTILDLMGQYRTIQDQTGPYRLIRDHRGISVKISVPLSLWDFIFSSNTHIEYRLYEYPQIRYFKMLQHGQVNELVTWTHVHVTSSIVHVITPKIYYSIS